LDICYLLVGRYDSDNTKSRSSLQAAQGKAGPVAAAANALRPLLRCACVSEEGK
jgi:hypothetical protein